MSPETYAAECRAWITEAAEARGGRRKVALFQIAREAGLQYQRIRAYFYGQVTNPSAAEYFQLMKWRDYEMVARMRRFDAESAKLRARIEGSPLA